jgi:CubicO group peptidase (beta-lactamase class C family)
MDFFHDNSLCMLLEVDFIPFFKNPYSVRLQAQPGLVKMRPKNKESREMLNHTESLDRYFEKTLQDFDLPGLAAAIVKDGEIVYMKGFGVRSVENGLPVTPDTLFAIGSTTKAFTAAMVGSLVDEGKLDWDTPLKEYIPWFKMVDPLATEMVAVRDMLCHRTGLPRHEVMWYRSPLSRKELVERLRYLEPSAGFRARLQYQNLVFCTAGYLAEVVTGLNYSDLVRERIFKPLGMKRSNFSVLDSQESDDFAHPHSGSTKIPFCNLDQIAPAGSINSCVSDMAQWLKMLTGEGKVDGRQVLSAETAKQLISSQMVVQDDPEMAILGVAEDQPEAYGLGWIISNYRGLKLVSHSGGIDGFVAEVALLPKQKVGLVVLTNNFNYGAMAAFHAMLDFVQDLEPIDWNQRYIDLRARLVEMMKAAAAVSDTERTPDTKPSHALESYAGEYSHPGYNSLVVECHDGKLTGTYNTIQFNLAHYHYDVFEADFGDIFGKIKMIFQMNAGGLIDRVAVPFEPKVNDIVFKRATDKK